MDPLNSAERMLATIYFDQPRSYLVGTKSDSDIWWGIALNFKSGSEFDDLNDAHYGITCQFRPKEIHLRGIHNSFDFVVQQGTPSSFENQEYRLEIEMKRSLTGSSVSGTISIDGNVSQSGYLAQEDCPPIWGSLAANETPPITAVGVALINQYMGEPGIFQNSTIQARLKSFRLRFDPIDK